MSDDDDEARHRGPTARELFSGESSPATLALQWCGWNTLTPVDIIHGPSHDLSKACVQEAIQSTESQVDAWLAGIDCTTQTRARGRPIPGVQNPPKPLRDELHLDGLPELEGEQSRRVQEANIAADWTFDLLDRGDTLYGAAGVAENPSTSWLGRRPRARALAAKQGWCSWRYKACCWCGARTRVRQS